ncbi:hypothetical protein HID58_030639 [Brassica napus]|uniref:Uncharacterized protein n=1 Tax=Brassica napus TaxID=3708 RepID=A0ABQ8CI37_BRANA|nr:hypothetical protein HID58_030639 [Brassica napus]
MISNTVILESAMVSNDELVKQHAKVAEDAVTARWEKAENEVVELNQKLEDAGMPHAGKEKIVLQDRVKSSQWGSSVLDK